IHAGTPQCHLAANGPAFANLETGFRLAGSGDDGLLAADTGHVCHRCFDRLAIGNRLPKTHVERDLSDVRSSHYAAVSELLDQCGHDLLAVVCLQSSRLFACIFHSHASTTSPVDLKYRTLRRLS